MSSLHIRLVSVVFLAAFVSANAQPSATGQGSQNANAAPSASSVPKSPAREAAEKSFPAELMYYSFIIDLKNQDITTQKEIRDLKPGEPPIIEGQVWCTEIGITLSQFQLILDTVKTTFSRLTENTRQIHLADDARRHGTTRIQEWDPKSKDQLALESEHNEIIYRMLRTLKQGLGDQDFAKFDKFVRFHWGGPNILPLKKPIDGQPEGK